MSWFDTCFDRLISHEGGYVFDPADPGGETKFGISKRSYPHLNIKELTREQAKEIYLVDFWLKIRADKLTIALSFQVFDFAVNSGISTAIRKLQAALGVADDGYWGPMSQMAADNLNTPAKEADVLFKLLALRIRYMTRLKNWKYHGAGWANRIADNLLFAAEDTP